MWAVDVLTSTEAAGPPAGAAARGGRSGRALAHQPALDGLRGLAVAGVLAYHLGWLEGGFLGVSLFFTLSGFLITNLLLAERDARGGIRLGAFWGRRFRRLLPAAIAGVGVAVAVTAAVGTPEQLRSLPGDVISSLAYVANWHFIAAHRSYGAGFAAPSTLAHYWSLSIEEQLYVGIPLLVVLAARGKRWRARLFVTVGALLAASAVATVIAGGAADPNRAYYGTDTRMAELLVGVLLAVALRFPGSTGGDARGEALTRRLRAAGPLALVATAGLWASVTVGSHWLYRGGLWGVALLSASLIVWAAWGGRGTAVLSTRPLAAVGRVSYGLYIYHWPIFVLLDARRTGVSGPALALVRLGATGLVAAGSLRWLEQPIRQGKVHRRSLAIAALASVAIAVVASLAASTLADARAVAGDTAARFALEARRGAAEPGPPAGLHRVLFIGDSLLLETVPTLASRMGRSGVEARSIGGFGQSLITHHAAWLTSLAAEVAGFDPDVVVLESCCAGFRSDGPWVGPDGDVLAPDSPAFYAEWRRLALEASRIASSRGALVLWVLAPPAHTNGWYGPVDARITPANEVYLSLRTCGPATATIDWRVVSGPGDAYAASLPDLEGRMVQVRLSDGFHFTPAGIGLLARLSIAALEQRWAAAGGRPGPWSGPCPAPARVP